MKDSMQSRLEEIFRMLDTDDDGVVDGTRICIDRISLVLL